MEIDNGRGKIVSAEIMPFVQDMLSVLYVTRVSHLEVGSELPIAVNTKGKNWELVVKVVKKQRIKVPAGKFDCIVVEPHMVGEGLFDAKGRIWVWMTDDKRHLPVKMKSKIAVGSITAELVDTIRQPKHTTYDTEGFEVK